MKRYIDADAAIKAIENDCPEVVFYTKRDAIDCIQAEPTADVVEVRHGYWTGMDGDKCSNCGRHLRDLMDADSYYSSEFEYSGFDALVACPFCGAKMDGERSEK